MKYFLWIVLITAISVAGWRIIAAQITNLVFQDELQDTVAQFRRVHRGVAARVERRTAQQGDPKSAEL
jgi:hypothetical protein